MPDVIDDADMPPARTRLLAVRHLTGIFRIRMRSPGDTIGRHDDPNPAIGGVHRALAAPMTLAHFPVSRAMILPKVGGRSWECIHSDS
jgi:hypothetical protein